MYRIRKANPQDLHQIRELLKRVEGDMVNLQSQQFLVAVSKKFNMIIGCGRLIDYQYFDEVASIAVDDKARKLGIGRNIVKNLVKQSHKKSIMLSCDLDKENFYTNIGFKKLSYIPKELVSKHIAYGDDEIIMVFYKKSFWQKIFNYIF